MHQFYRWELIPSSWPTVIRSCPKCGNAQAYTCSGNFRVNANQNNLDIWLIYQCCKCKSTWNMEILSRTKVKTIDKEMYHRFITNDPELARQYAFDAAIHGYNKVTVNYDEISYTIQGAVPEFAPGSTECRIEITSPYPVDLRLDALLSRQLGLSREKIKNLWKSGKIKRCDGKDITKFRLNGSLSIILLPWNEGSE